MSGVSFENVLAALKEGSVSSTQNDQDESRKACVRWMGFRAETGGTRMSQEEQISLRAMIAYVSHHTGRSEFKIEEALSDQFGVPNIQFISAEKYNQAMAVLADQVLM